MMAQLSPFKLFVMVLNKMCEFPLMPTISMLPRYGGIDLLFCFPQNLLDKIHYNAMPICALGRCTSFLSLLSVSYAWHCRQFSILHFDKLQNNKKCSSILGPGPHSTISSLRPPILAQHCTVSASSFFFVKLYVSALVFNRGGDPTTANDRPRRP